MRVRHDFHHQHPTLLGSALSGLGINNVPSLEWLILNHPDWQNAWSKIGQLLTLTQYNNQAQVIAFANANNLFPYEVALMTLANGMDPAVIQASLYFWLFGYMPLSGGNVTQDTTWLQEFVDGGGTYVPPPMYDFPYPTPPPGAIYPQHSPPPGYVAPPAPTLAPIYMGPAPSPTPTPGPTGTEAYFVNPEPPPPSVGDTSVYVTPSAIPSMQAITTYVAPYSTPAPAPSTIVWGTSPSPTPTQAPIVAPLVTAAPLPVATPSGGIVTTTYDAAQASGPTVTVSDAQGNPVQVPVILTAPAPSTPASLPQNTIPSYVPTTPTSLPSVVAMPAPTPAISSGGGQVIDTTAPSDTGWTGASDGSSLPGGTSAGSETLNPAAGGHVSPLVLALAALVFVTAIK